jgi:hypothetical protein
MEEDVIDNAGKRVNQQANGRCPKGGQERKGVHAGRPWLLTEARAYIRALGKPQAYKDRRNDSGCNIVVRSRLATC